MARYTSAYSSLLVRLKEVQILNSIARLEERHNPIENRYKVNALCRGSIVLLCSHLEAYIKELGETLLSEMYRRRLPRDRLEKRFYYHISKDILGELKNITDPDRIACKLFEFLASDGPYWDSNGPLPAPIAADRFNRGFSNPGYRKIRKYFGRFGYNEFDSELRQSLDGDYQPIVNMVNHLVHTRNKIAHGDTDAVKTPGDVAKMVDLIRLFCRATDCQFGSWCRKRLCAVR